MKILALNSSPRGEGQSKTELLLNHLVGGMRDAGAEVEIVNPGTPDGMACNIYIKKAGCVTPCLKSLK